MVSQYQWSFILQNRMNECWVWFSLPLQVFITMSCFFFLCSCGYGIVLTNSKQDGLHFQDIQRVWASETQRVWDFRVWVFDTPPEEPTGGWTFGNWNYNCLHKWILGNVMLPLQKLFMLFTISELPVLTLILLSRSCGHSQLSISLEMCKGSSSF